MSDYLKDKGVGIDEETDEVRKAVMFGLLTPAMATDGITWMRLEPQDVPGGILKEPLEVGIYFGDTKEAILEKRAQLQDPNAEMKVKMAMRKRTSPN